MDEVLEFLNELFRPEAEAFDLGVLQMLARSFIVFLTAVMMVRLGQKRFMGRNTAFDMLLGIMLGSMLSRAITGQSPMLPTLVASAALVVSHWLLGAIALRFGPAAPWVKGEPRPLIRNGQMLRENMRKSQVGEHDVMEALRLKGGATSLDRVEDARLERNGNISIILKPDDRQPRVVDLRVAEGVQTVRIVME